MSELPSEVRTRTDILDTVGNTTAATGKGFAIASAALTALALFAAYVTFTGIDGINIFKAPVLSALFVGAMIPVVFSALAMSAVGKASMAMVKEVRRQFKDIPGIMEGKAEPEYDKCVEISTEASLKEMMLPGLLTIVTPILIAFTTRLLTGDTLLAAEVLGGYMAGVTVSGVMWAIFQNNAGGAWDNAKKSFEAGVEIDGEMTYKGSDAHKAAVTGDTVGDPFKDTSGPSMNILIKLTCLVGLVIAPLLSSQDSHGANNNHNNVQEAIVIEEQHKELVDVIFNVNGSEFSGQIIARLVHAAIMEEGSRVELHMEFDPVSVENVFGFAADMVFDGLGEPLDENFNRYIAQGQFSGGPNGEYYDTQLMFAFEGDDIMVGDFKVR